MRLLLDTHVLLWWLADEPLAPAAAEAIAEPANDVWVSAASIWEIAIKRAAGRLTFDADPVDASEAAGFALLPIGPRHAVDAAALPEHHRDPFDRMLVAQARMEQMTLVSRDTSVQAYEVTVLRA
jgi:PIN domain nuclease of toxin-antitoxin system